MKHFICILLISIFVNSDVSSQKLYLLQQEELQIILDTLKDNDTNKVDVLNELAYKLRNSNSKRAEILALESFKISDSINYDLGMSFSQVVLGLLAKRKKDLDTAENYFLEALNIRKKSGNARDVASVYNNLGLLFSENDSQKAKFYYESGLKSLTDESIAFKATLHNNLGGMLIHEKNFESAISHLYHALSIRKTFGSIRKLADLFLNIGSLHLELKDSSQFIMNIDSAHYYYTLNADSIGIAKVMNFKGKFAVSIQDFDSATYFFQLAYQTATNKSREQYKYYRNLGSILIRQKRYEEAGNIIGECIEYFEKARDFREVASLLANKGTIYYENNNYEDAIEYYERALLYLIGVEDLDLKSQTLLFLSASYAYIGNTKKALETGEEYVTFSNKLESQKSAGFNRLLDQQEIMNENAILKVKEITSEMNLEKEKSRKNRAILILIGLIIFFLFVVALVSALIFRQKKRIAEFEIDAIISRNERETNYARLEEQESVKNKIARELHDRLGSMFTLIKLSLSDVESAIANIKKENVTHYNKVNDLIDQACDEVRNIAHDLRNSTLANFGLKVALESLTESLNNQTIKIDLLTHNLEEYRLENKIEVNVYQVIQELISNALKHSKASKMTIQLNRFDNRLNISIEDNGIGFDRYKVKMGMGIHNIETRILELHGTFNLDSSQGNGTTVMIDIPLKNKI